MIRKKREKCLGVTFAIVVCFASSGLAPRGLDAENTSSAAQAVTNDNRPSESQQEALEHLEQEIPLLIQSGKTDEAARSLNRAGRLQLQLHDPEKAVDSHKRALLLLRTRADELKVDSLNGLGAAYVVLQNPRAEESLNTALNLSQQIGYRAGQAQALLSLSDWENYDNHVTALGLAQKALVLWRDLDDKEGLARTHSQIGRCYMAQSMLAESTTNYQEALRLWREINNPSQQAGALIMLGFIEYRKGEWQSSISHFTEAQSLIDEKANPDKMGQIAAGLAESFNENGLPEDGLTHYRRALVFYHQTKDPHLVRYATWGLGCTYYLLGDYPEALNHLERALVGVSKDSLSAAQSLEYIGRVHIATGEYVDALHSLQSALTVYERTNNPKEAAQVRGLMAQAYEQQGRLDEGRRYYLQAMKSFVALSDRVNQAAVSFALGRLELRGGNFDVAEELLRKSIEATEDLRRLSRSSDLTTAFSASVHERYQAYIECLMHMHQARPQEQLDVRAFETSELARARSLKELLRSSATTFVPGLDPVLAQREKSLRQSLQIKEISKVALLRTAYKKEELEALQQEIARIESEHRQITETILARYPSYAKLADPEGWNLPRIQTGVVADDQTALLEYSLGIDKSYLWVVTRTSIKSYELPAEAQINAAALRVHQLLSTPTGSADTENLRAATLQLSQMVLSPIAALEKSRLIIIADGALHYVPFQVLNLPPDAEAPLVANYEVVNAPSASILGELREETGRRQIPRMLLAAFGDPVFPSNYAQRKDQPNMVQASAPLRGDVRSIDQRNKETNSSDQSELKPLIYSGVELANLRNMSSRAGSYVASSFAATREELLTTDLSQFAILHLATHGFLDTKRPENSGLVLSTVNRDGQPVNGFVGLEEIYKLQAPVDVVVLSACQTALGKEMRGEGLIGLTRGFMYAGASSVVASLWRVDDEATSELMKSFYSNMLQNGMPPAAALRAAQNTIRQRPEWKSPHHWAGFTLQGEYRQFIRTAQPSLNPVHLGGLIGLGLAVTIIGGGFLYLRSRSRRALIGHSTLK
jgi:CHAT domain-containing protein